MNTKRLAQAIRDYSRALCDDGCGTPSTAKTKEADTSELLRVLSRILEGKPIARAFGAPGDWGYGTPIGDALAAAPELWEIKVGTEVEVVNDQSNLFAHLGTVRAITADGTIAAVGLGLPPLRWQQPLMLLYVGELTIKQNHSRETLNNQGDANVSNTSNSADGAE